ncbi:hypothetical protein [Sphingomonas sp. MA1305]|uniref:hypothetical protein n=1 Tax=Sphingomonas sp. MA1305 TaxID=2479204 RepID=UPI0018DF4E54|nr:hypothetical protein [Sphingomonas sp. MA1305]
MSYYDSPDGRCDGFPADHLSEVVDDLYGIILARPRFDQVSGWQGISVTDGVFDCLVRGLDNVRDKLGDARHAELVALAGQAKDLFNADLDDENGKATQARWIIHDMITKIEAGQAGRIVADLPDVDGEVTGD